ncbi:gene transfer agent family protein [Tropicimonas sp. S265A]|uniref:gene transfer agent family protein n=1 Tax=Tropicimonas sp. S265A TaxID=3415134 RepID=UPI003C7DBBB2
MANPYAGEVALTINGEPRILKLTLGALATLEATLETDSLIALVERFEGGGYRARDVLFLIEAGLQGGGTPMSLASLAEADFEGGPLAAARAAAVLLARAFALPPEVRS